MAINTSSFTTPQTGRPPLLLGLQTTAHSEDKAVKLRIQSKSMITKENLANTVMRCGKLSNVVVHCPSPYYPTIVWPYRNKASLVEKHWDTKNHAKCSLLLGPLFEQ
jgi:hypothetical protein